MVHGTGAPANTDSGCWPVPGCNEVSRKVCLPPADLKTDAVLNIDDDLHIPCDLLDQALAVRASGSAVWSDRSQKYPPVVARWHSRRDIANNCVPMRLCSSSPCQT